MQASTEREWRRLRRERLIEAARRVFAAQGFEKASMDEIAGTAGAGKPTLYRYFASKDALFEAVFVDALDSLEESLSAAERAAPDPLEALRGMVSALVPLFREHVATLRSFSDSATPVDRSRRRILRQRAAVIEARLAAVLGRGRRSGVFRHTDDALAARLIYGMVWSGSVANAWDDVTIIDSIVATVSTEAPRLVRVVHGRSPAAEKDQPAVSQSSRSAAAMGGGTP